MIARVLDFECTGLEATDHVIEIGSIDVIDGALKSSSARNAWVRPPCPVPPASSAIHHITDEDVAGAKTWPDVWPLFLDPGGDEGVEIFVAHAASFERQWVDPLKPLMWICTYKCALRAWPELESHSNQAIRYARSLPVDKKSAMPPHRALPDAYVTAHILLDLLETYPLETLVKWSAEPACYPTVPFGKHQGMKWAEVPADYLDWIVGPKNDLDEDVRWNARRELQHRDDAVEAAVAAQREAYTEAAIALIKQAATVEDLRCWFAWEAEARAKIKIYPNTEWYGRIVDACKARTAELPPEIPKPEAA